MGQQAVQQVTQISKQIQTQRQVKKVVAHHPVEESEHKIQEVDRWLAVVVLAAWVVVHLVEVKVVEKEE